MINLWLNAMLNCIQQAYETWINEENKLKYIWNLNCETLSLLFEYLYPITLH